MRHCSPEDLALAALGEDLPPADTHHLAGCRSCTSEVASLRRAVDALGGPDVDAPVPLPARVWEAIAAETGVAGGPRPAQRPVPAAVPIPRTGAAAAPVARARLGAAVVELPARPAPRPRQRRLVGGAVAASLLVGFGLGAVAWPRGSGDDGGDGEVGRSVTEVALDPVDGWTATGAATLLDQDGALELQVDLATPPAADGFYEVWLLGGDSGAVALGVLADGSGRYPLPAGVDLAYYGVVDVSLEPFDGDPQHSTDSVARGDLS